LVNKYVVKLLPRAYRFKIGGFFGGIHFQIGDNAPTELAKKKKEEN